MYTGNYLDKLSTIGGHFKVGKVGLNSQVECYRYQPALLEQFISLKNVSSKFQMSTEDNVPFSVI